jgi:RNA processing factor Prp31
VGDVLKAGLEKRLEEIREKYKEPPPIQEKKPRMEQRPERREQRWRDKKWRKDRLARKG